MREEAAATVTAMTAILRSALLEQLQLGPQATVLYIEGRVMLASQPE
jgi:hypothetical protein